jgi:two-component system CheB/CheR fusion protein
MVDGDAGKIQRIVQNLVLNAIKVTETGGVKVTRESGSNLKRPQWALCVQDTGPASNAAPHHHSNAC